MIYVTGMGFFPPGSYIMGDAATKKGYFVFPSKKEYIEMDVEKMEGTANEMMKSMKMTYANQKVDVSTLPPKLVEGTLCSGKRVSLSWEATASIMGFTSKTRTEEVTDYYVSDKVDALALFGGRNWYSMGMVTGDKAFDKVVADKVGFIGFPVQVISHRVENGEDRGTTTYTVKDISLGPILPGTFDLPAGYTKTEFGFGTMMGGGQGKRGRGGAAEERYQEDSEGSQEEQQEEQDQPPEQQQEQQQQPQQQKKPSLKDLLKGLGG
jgi:hypothetical protein